MDKADVRTADDDQDTRLVVRSSAAQSAYRKFPKKRAAPETSLVRSSAAQPANRSFPKKRAAPETSVVRSSTAQPADRKFPKKRAAPGTPELQPRPPPFPPPVSATGEGTALPTTLDALLEIKGMIYSARASDYLNWKKAHPSEPQKSACNLIGRFQIAIRQKFHSTAGSTGQSAKSGEPKVPFAVLIGWLVEKMRAHGTDLEDGKELLWDLAQREHQRSRFTKMFRKVNEMECGDSEEKRIDVQVLNEIAAGMHGAIAKSAGRALRLAVGMHGAI